MHSRPASTICANTCAQRSSQALNIIALQTAARYRPGTRTQAMHTSCRSQPHRFWPTWVVPNKAVSRKHHIRTKNSWLIKLAAAPTTPETAKSTFHDVFANVTTDLPAESKQEPFIMVRAFGSVAIAISRARAFLTQHCDHQRNQARHRETPQQISETKKNLQADPPKNNNT